MSSRRFSVAYRQIHLSTVSPNCKSVTSHTGTHVDKPISVTTTGNTVRASVTWAIGLAWQALEDAGAPTFVRSTKKEPWLYQLCTVVAPCTRKLAEVRRRVENHGIGGRLRVEEIRLGDFPGSGAGGGSLQYRGMVYAQGHWRVYTKDWKISVKVSKCD